VRSEGLQGLKNLQQGQRYITYPCFSIAKVRHGGEASMGDIIGGGKLIRFDLPKTGGIGVSKREESWDLERG